MTGLLPSGRETGNSSPLFQVVFDHQGQVQTSSQRLFTQQQGQSSRVTPLVRLLMSPPPSQCSWDLPGSPPENDNAKWRLGYAYTVLPGIITSRTTPWSGQRGLKQPKNPLSLLLMLFSFKFSFVFNQSHCLSVLLDFRSAGNFISQSLVSSLSVPW